MSLSIPEKRVLRFLSNPLRSDDSGLDPFRLFPVADLGDVIDLGDGMLNVTCVAGRAGNIVWGGAEARTDRFGTGAAVFLFCDAIDSPRSIFEMM